MESGTPHSPKWPNEHDLALVEDLYYFMLSRILRVLRQLPGKSAKPNTGGTTATGRTAAAA
jgi:hypothetical protein